MSALKKMVVGESLIIEASPQEIRKIYNVATKLGRKSQTEYMYAPILNVPAIKQSKPKDCILVCVLAIARYYGIAADEERIIQAYGTHYSDETASTYSDAKQFLEHLGFRTRYIDPDLVSLQDAKRAGHPVIFDVRTAQKLGHAIVFLGFDNEWVYWMDPAYGKYIKTPTRLHDTLAEDNAAALEVWPGSTLKLAI